MKKQSCDPERRIEREAWQVSGKHIRSRGGVGVVGLQSIEQIEADVVAQRIGSKSEVPCSQRICYKKIISIRHNKLRWKANDVYAERIGFRSDRVVHIFLNQNHLIRRQRGFQKHLDAQGIHLLRLIQKKRSGHRDGVMRFIDNGRIA